jgi:hypothetical protein
MREPRLNHEHSKSGAGCVHRWAAPRRNGQPPPGRRIPAITAVRRRPSRRRQPDQGCRPGDDHLEEPATPRPHNDGDHSTCRVRSEHLPGQVQRGPGGRVMRVLHRCHQRQQAVQAELGSRQPEHHRAQRSPAMKHQHARPKHQARQADQPRHRRKTAPSPRVGKGHPGHDFDRGQARPSRRVRRGPESHHGHRHIIPDPALSGTQQASPPGRLVHQTAPPCAATSRSLKPTRPSSSRLTQPGSGAAW